MSDRWDPDFDAETERADMHAFRTGVHPGEQPNAWMGDVPGARPQLRNATQRRHASAASSGR